VSDVLNTALDVLGVALIALGIVVTGVTVYGVVRMRGLYSRLQAASKASMLGAVAILAASVGTHDGATIARAVVVALFLLLTTPIAAHAIAQAAYRRDASLRNRRSPNSSSRSTASPSTAPNCDS
jgi:multicomponent Na+:H+ antiporter subunit G